MQSIYNTEIPQISGNSCAVSQAKSTLLEVALCYRDKKITETELLKSKNADINKICDGLILLNAMELDDAASLLKESFENAGSEKAASFTGRMLMAVFTGIRIKGVPREMFRSYIYLKEVVPRLYYDKEQKPFTGKVLQQMAEIHNRYETRLYPNQRPVKQGYGRINPKAHMLNMSDFRDQNMSGPMEYMLPIHLGAMYERLLPKELFKNKQHIEYMEKCEKLQKKLYHINTHKEDAWDRFKDLRIEAKSPSGLSEQDTEYKSSTFPQLAYIISFIQESEYGMCMDMHNILHTRMTKEEKEYFEVDGKSLLKGFAKAIFYYLPLFFIKKFYAPIIVLLVLRFYFHLDLFATSRGLFGIIKGILSGAGEIIVFMFHHPLIALVMILFIILSPDGTKTSGSGGSYKPLVPPTPGDEYYQKHGYDIYADTNMPRDFKVEGFSMEGLAMEKK